MVIHDVQATPKSPFIRPEGVDPSVHLQNCSDHLTWITECCRKADRNNQPPVIGEKSWGKIVDLPSFTYITPAEAKSRKGSSSNTTNLPTIAITDSAVDSQLESSRCLPDLKSNFDFIDYNQNMVTRRQRQGQSTAAATKQSVLDTISDADTGDSDFEPRPSAGRSHAATKKEAAGPSKHEAFKNLKAEGRLGKQQTGRGRAAARCRKKEPTGNESKKPRMPRKAKDSANNQMKLQFLSDSTSRPHQSDYNDALADDVYAMGFSSPERTAYTSYRYSRQKDKKSADAAGGNIPPLVERMRDYALSQRFDRMLEDEGHAPLRDYSRQSVGISETDWRSFHIGEATTSKEAESIPRYLYYVFVLTTFMNALMLCL